ncbi:hypothetical protein HRbin02_01257 [Candidatus Calditenuaceae archaeon HR02]|nr:hypothetical protein HRbin02_01257 [Candidatus Calditenuaceae archaeon HR02]
MSEDGMELLCRPVVEAVRERFGRLAETQRRAIPHIFKFHPLPTRV